MIISAGSWVGIVTASFAEPEGYFTFPDRPVKQPLFDVTNEASTNLLVTFDVTVTITLKSCMACNETVDHFFLYEDQRVAKRRAERMGVMEEEMMSEARSSLQKSLASRKESRMFIASPCNTLHVVHWRC